MAAITHAAFCFSCAARVHVRAAWVRVVACDRPERKRSRISHAIVRAGRQGEARVSSQSTHSMIEWPEEGKRTSAPRAARGGGAFKG
eukprot:6469820-Alexandrium_andersonii.AAC.1